MNGITAPILTNVTIDAQFIDVNEQVMYKISEYCVLLDDWRLKIPYMLIIYILLQFVSENIDRLKLQEKFVYPVKRVVSLSQGLIIIVAIILILYDVGVM